MVREFARKDIGSKQWRRREDNIYGQHDQAHYHPYLELMIRCPKCNNIMAGDFTMEGECPSCHWVFTKAEAVDMCVESYALKVQGGWSKEALDLMGKYDVPVVMSPEGDVRAVDMVARNMYAMAIAALRRRDEARVAMINELRNSGPKIPNPYTRKLL